MFPQWYEITFKVDDEVVFETQADLGCIEWGKIAICFLYLTGRPYTIKNILKRIICR